MAIDDRLVEVTAHVRQMKRWLMGKEGQVQVGPSNTVPGEGMNGRSALKLVMLC